MHAFAICGLSRFCFAMTFGYEISFLLYTLGLLEGLSAGPWPKGSRKRLSEALSRALGRLVASSIAVQKSQAQACNAAQAHLCYRRHHVRCRPCRLGSGERPERSRRVAHCKGTLAPDDALSCFSRPETPHPPGFHQQALPPRLYPSSMPFADCAQHVRYAEAGQNEAAAVLHAAREAALQLGVRSTRLSRCGAHCSQT